MSYKLCVASDTFIEKARSYCQDRPALGMTNNLAYNTLKYYVTLTNTALQNTMSLSRHFRNYRDNIFETNLSSV